VSQLGDLGEQIHIALGIDGHHRVPLADILFDDVLHDSSLANPGGAKAPEMALAMAVGHTQFHDRLRMIKMHALSNMGPGHLRLCLFR
jgi:hypothetical protein